MLKLLLRDATAKRTSHRCPQLLYGYVPFAWEHILHASVEILRGQKILIITCKYFPQSEGNRITLR
jgi:hypothetical protein